MSLMGVIMMTGIVVSNSILIVEFAGTLHKEGLPLKEAVIQSCRIRLRPILMTSLATLLGMIPMALGMEAGANNCAASACWLSADGSFRGRNRFWFRRFTWSFTAGTTRSPRLRGRFREWPDRVD